MVTPSGRRTPLRSNDVVVKPAFGRRVELAVDLERDRARRTGGPLPAALVVPLRVGLPGWVGPAIAAPGARVGDAQGERGGVHDPLDRRRALWNLLVCAA